MSKTTVALSEDQRFSTKAWLWLIKDNLSSNHPKLTRISSLKQCKTATRDRSEGSPRSLMTSVVAINQQASHQWGVHCKTNPNQRYTKVLPEQLHAHLSNPKGVPNSITCHQSIAHSHSIKRRERFLSELTTHLMKDKARLNQNQPSCFRAVPIIIRLLVHRSNNN